MFNFFSARRYALWGVPGAMLIALAIYVQVRIDLEINTWFGDFYNQIQRSLNTPGGVKLNDLIDTLMMFGYLAGSYVVINTLRNFFTSHWTFRWRTSMVERYHKNYGGKPIEGASQRVQEDTLKFARLMEDLGSNLVEAIMSVVMFTPLLLTLGATLIVPNYMPWVESHPLVWAALITSIGGALFMFALGQKLPGLEYDIQAKEAAYRKSLTLGEDDGCSVSEGLLSWKYEEVRKVHYKSYWHYFYFNAGRWSFLQFNVIVPYLVMAPSIVGGLLTLGLITQIGHAFRAVAGNLQYLIRSWPQIVELLSVYRRLSEYERNI